MSIKESQYLNTLRSCSLQELLDAGLNAFAVQLLIESYLILVDQQKKAFPIDFAYAGVEISIRPYHPEKRRGQKKAEVEDEWENFWKEIVTDEKGNPDLEQIKRELADYSFILEQVPVVYNHITCGRLSKPNYYADQVTSLADDLQNKDIREHVKEAIENERQRITAIIETLPNLLTAALVTDIALASEQGTDLQQIKDLLKEEILKDRE